MFLLPEGQSGEDWKLHLVFRGLQWVILQLTANGMDQSFLSIWANCLRNLKVHKNLSPGIFLSQLNPVQILIPLFLWCILTLSAHLSSVFRSKYKISLERKWMVNQLRGQFTEQGGYVFRHFCKPSSDLPTRSYRLSWSKEWCVALLTWTRRTWISSGRHKRHPRINRLQPSSPGRNWWWSADVVRKSPRESPSNCLQHKTHHHQ